ncbi:MAG TPA: cytochrome c biogenesis protein CcsA [Phycisphaeraceae bacterium]
MILTLLSLAAWGLAIHRLRHPQAVDRSTAVQRGMLAAIGLGAAGLFFYRWWAVHGRWQPLASHVDGLLLIAALFALTVLYVTSRPKLAGLAAFAVPVLSLVLAWGVCASAWTYKPFDLPTLHPVWNAVHLAGVYLGTCGAALAAMAGGMFLYIQARLKRKAGLESFGQLASLESLEGLIIRAATLGFALLTLGLVAGLVILSDRPLPVEERGWFVLKLSLAVLAWLMYALVMNVRHAASFRGRRAAWLAIAGLALLLTIYGLMVSLPRGGPAAGSEPTAQEAPLAKEPV